MLNIKSFSLAPLLLLGFILFAPPALADDYVAITGTAYGENIGLIHFDFKTAKRPDPIPTDSRYFVGPTRQFYIDPYDKTYFSKNKPFVAGDAEGVEVAGVGTSGGDCPGTKDYCFLRGYAWSDTIGWILFDGLDIQNSIKAIEGAGWQDSHYPQEKFPQIKKTEVAGRLALTGYAWNEHTGWIRLAGDDSKDAAGVTLDAKLQTSTEWGVWLDKASKIELQVVDAGPPAITEKLGRRLHGYAWSERLGWIKFSKESEDTFDFEFKTYTLWIPDDTPPISLTPSTVWFAVGVNTNYMQPSGTDVPYTTMPTTIVWSDVAIDPESGINTRKSKIHLAPIGGDPACLSLPEGSPMIGKLAYPMPNDYPVAGTGDILHLILPTIGNLQGSPFYGYCQYALSAEIWNDVNLVSYIGTNYGAGSPSSMYVRAGYPTDSKSSISLPGGPNALADGESTVEYQGEFKDIAGNLIVPIKESTCSGCPLRNVNLTADIKNELLFDLSQSVPPSIPYTTPARYKINGGNGWSELAIKAVPDSEYLGGQKWRIPFTQNTNDYSLLIASFAPSESYNIYKQAPLSKKFNINSLDYQFADGDLPSTAKQIENLNDPANPVLGDKPNTKVAACEEPDDPATPAVGACLPSIWNGQPRVAVPGKIPTNVETELVFLPPVYTDGGSLKAGALENVLTLSIPAELTFKVNNVSSSKGILADTNDHGGLSVDTIFQFTSKDKTQSNFALSLMEVHKIHTETDPDTHFAWTNPFETEANSKTRYEMYMAGGNYYVDLSAPQPPIPLPNPFSATNSPFIGAFISNHNLADKTAGSRFLFDLDLGYKYIDSAKFPSGADISSLPDQPLPDMSAAEIDNDGRYFITGLSKIPVEQNQITPAPAGDSKDIYNYLPGYIDRSDDVNLDLVAGDKINPSSITKKIIFTPEKFIPITVKDVQMQIVQEIVYRFKDQITPTVYASKNPLLENIDVKDIGLEATGTVAGKETVTGRKFDVVNLAGARKLQEQMRRNVAELTAGFKVPDACKLTPSTSKTLNAFETSGNCVLIDTINNTRIAYYEGDQSTMLILEDTTDNLIEVPALRYTIILKGGASLFIKSNIKYQTGSSLGLIVIADTVGQGANTYISPAPTNIAGMLYTEGYLLSRSDDGKLYYGATGGLAGGDVKTLSNQLYWQGSIASRNTIGGAGSGKKPEGAPCIENDSGAACAQRYDLDYLRRFTAVVDTLGKTSKIANGGKFSGGGLCDNLGKCVAGSLPSKVVLSGTPGDQFINETKSELAPFFVERDLSAINNPPPGFALPGGMESYQEIR